MRQEHCEQFVEAGFNSHDALLAEDPGRVTTNDEMVDDPGSVFGAPCGREIEKAGWPISRHKPNFQTSIYMYLDPHAGFPAW